MWKYHRCYGFIINCTFQTEKNYLNKMVCYFIGFYLINRTLHGCLEIRNFSSCVEKNISLVHCAHSWNIFQHSKRNFVSPSDLVIPSSHMRAKVIKANKSLFVLGSLCKEGMSQEEVDHLFNAIVLPNFSYALPVYGASDSDLSVIQNFLDRCMKRKFMSKNVNIRDLLEKADKTLQKKIEWPVFNLGRVFASFTQNILFWRKMKWSWGHTDAKKRNKQKPPKISFLVYKYFQSSRQ